MCIQLYFVDKFYRVSATKLHLLFQRLHLLCPFTLFLVNRKVKMILGFNRKRIKNKICVFISSLLTIIFFANSFFKPTNVRTPICPFISWSCNKNVATLFYQNGYAPVIFIGHLWKLQKILYFILYMGIYQCFFRLFLKDRRSREHIK